MIGSVASGRGGTVLAALDLEGVLIPEIWHAIAAAFGLPSLLVTTREEADYGRLMERRLAMLREAGLGWEDLRPVLAGMEPLPGAEVFLSRLRGRVPFVVVTDGFDLFIREAARRLELDTVFCHSLSLGAGGELVGWTPRIPDSKRAAARCFAALGYTVRAAGDSLNDIPMLEEAERGVLFHPSEAAIAAGAGRFEVCDSYEELERAFTA
jgi:phosphoserine / homoserine phosphotransferase